MMIAKGLALVSVLWNLAGNSEAPFLDRQPVRAPGGTSVSASATTAQPIAPVAPVIADNPAAPAQESSSSAAPESAAAPQSVPSVAPVVSAAPPIAPSPAGAAAAAPIVVPSPEVAAVEDGTEAEPAPAAAVTSGPRLPLPPQKGPVLTAVHVTGWVMQLPQRLAGLIAASKAGGLTAMIFEVKDVNGELFFKMESSDGTNRFSEAIKACHDANLKVIARYCVFKDKLAEEKFAGTRYGTTPGTATRHKPWTNPQTKATQDYNLGLIKELVAMGVDEINLDYIRFPSAPEGVHIDMPLPTKCKAIADFVRRVRAVVPKKVRLSMDVFGYVAWDENSARVGQRLEDLAPYVDGIYPMLYPDHFAKGDLGFKQPVEHPYEVIRRGCEAARAKKGMEHVDVIPWLQAFSLGSDSITYGPTELLAQMQGARDAGVPSWLAWNPRVNYADLDKAMATVKGKSNYTPWVKKYIPQKYLLASATGAGLPATGAGAAAANADADADAEEAAPATPAAKVGAQTTRPTAAALELENVDPTAIPKPVPSAAPATDSVAAPVDGSAAGVGVAPAGAVAAPKGAAAAPAATAAAPVGAAAAPVGTAAAPAQGAVVAAESAPPGAPVAASGAGAGAIQEAKGTPLGAAPFAPPVTGGAGAASASVTNAPAGGAPASAVAAVAPVAPVAPAAPVALAVAANPARVVPPELAAVTPVVAPGAKVTAPTPVTAESAAVPPPVVGATADQPVEAPSNPFASAPGGAEPRADSATLGAAPAPKSKAKGKGKTKKGGAPAVGTTPAAAGTKAKKPKKRPAAGLEELPDDDSDAKLYRYQPK